MNKYKYRDQNSDNNNQINLMSIMKESDVLYSKSSINNLRAGL